MVIIGRFQKKYLSAEIYLWKIYIKMTIWAYFIAFYSKKDAFLAELKVMAIYLVHCNFTTTLFTKIREIDVFT